LLFRRDELDGGTDGGIRDDDDIIEAVQRRGRRRGCARRAQNGDRIKVGGTMAHVVSPSAKPRPEGACRVRFDAARARDSSALC
jgi:hypothetical protein